MSVKAMHHPTALYEHGLDALRNGGVAKGIGLLQESLRLDPRQAQAHLQLGNAFMQLRRPREALASYDQAAGLRADFLEAAVGRGLALHALDVLEEALAAFEHALKLKPDAPDALFRRAVILRQLRRGSAAADAFAHLLSVSPEYPFALGHLMQDRLPLCDWTEYAETVQKIAAGLRSGTRVCLPWSLLRIADSAEQQLQGARIYMADKQIGRLAAQPPIRRTHHDRLRVAYISADFCDHPVAHALAGVLERHDRARIECIAVALRRGDDSPVARRIRSAVDRYIDVSSCKDQTVASMLREAEIDIAVDLMGFTGSARPTIFAHRAAPVQVNFLGFPGTLGVPNIDYIIADRTVIPPWSQGQYSEKVAYLPHCFLPNDTKRIAERMPSRAEHGLPPQGFVFCCFNAHYKISPPVFALWMRLLQATEDSVLWLADGNEAVRANLLKEAAACGIAPARIVFAARLADSAEHLARHCLADLFLDTLPYNAHSTAGDALWAGLPVLTCLGGSFAGRVGASLLTTIGLPELITPDLAAYEALARQLAASPGALADLRLRLERNRAASPLFDAAQYCRHLEAAYAQMWDTYKHGGAPESFSARAEQEILRH